MESRATSSDDHVKKPFATCPKFHKSATFYCLYYPISSISVLVSDEMMMSICDVYFKIILKIMMVKVPICVKLEIRQ
jgi:hypothetical protein